MRGEMRCEKPSMTVALATANDSTFYSAKMPIVIEKTWFLDEAI